MTTTALTRAEKARVDGIVARIDEIRNAPVKAAMLNLAACEMMAADLAALSVDASFAEYRERAINVLADAKTAVASIIAAKLAVEKAAFEAERAEAAAKAEADRQRAADEEAKAKAARDAEEAKARAAEEIERQRKRDEEDARRAITSEIRQQIDAELETFSDCELRIVLDFVRKMPL